MNTAANNGMEPIRDTGRDKVLGKIIYDVGRRLAERHDQKMVDTVMSGIAGEFQDARITSFLPILIQKEASDRIRILSQVNVQPNVGGGKLNFLRFEFKYILGEKLRDSIEKDICHFMMLDPFVAKQKDHSYMVRSLYYDDPAFSCYYQKIDGALRRAKFRLRTYTDDPEDTCATYLEIKGRYNSLVFKRRAGFKASAGSRIFADCASTTSEILNAINDSPVAGQFRYELARKQIRPVMLIDYIRRPYFSRYDPEFRLTFDDRLHGAVTDRLFPDSARDRRELLPGRSVMEIKFKDRIPLWFHRIIRSYGLERKSISKVCKGIEAWNLVPQLD